MLGMGIAVFRLFFFLFRCCREVGGLDIWDLMVHAFSKEFLSLVMFRRCITSALDVAEASRGYALRILSLLNTFHSLLLPEYSS